MDARHELSERSCGEACARFVEPANTPKTRKPLWNEQSVESMGVRMRLDVLEVEFARAGVARLPYFLPVNEVGGSFDYETRSLVGGETDLDISRGRSGNVVNGRRGPSGSKSCDTIAVKGRNNHFGILEKSLSPGGIGELRAELVFKGTQFVNGSYGIVPGDSGLSRAERDGEGLSVWTFRAHLNEQVGQSLHRGNHKDGKGLGIRGQTVIDGKNYFIRTWRKIHDGDGCGGEQARSIAIKP